MGRRGPKPTPTAVLRLRGSKRAKSRPREPAADGRKPRRPAWLKGDAAKKWGELVGHLWRLGVLDSIDREALARYCRLWQRWREAEEKLAAGQSIYALKDKDGAVRCLQQSPWVAIANKLAIELRRLEQEFGMTPAARARVEVKPAKDPGETGILGFAKSKGA